MKFTTKWIYSIRAIFDLVNHSNGKPVSLASISKRQNISLPFLAQIFQKLRKGGIVKSIRGPKGGFILTKDCKDISIGEVLIAVDELSYGIKQTDNSTDPFKHHKVDECISNLLWRKLGNQILELLDTTCLADLMEETKCPDICAFIPSKKGKRTRST